MTVVFTERPSPNWNERREGACPDMVILHYTGMHSATSAIERLSNPGAKVSSHYVIDQAGRIIRLVDESRRAWHAGVSFWRGDTDINSRSIGIELVNRGHAHGYSEFPEMQMQALILLLEGICVRHRIPARHILAHSDVAPARKKDPGERFDWQRIWRAGFGVWVPPAPILSAPAPARTESTTAGVQLALAEIGYGVKGSGRYDQPTVDAITAFQRHWRPSLVDGQTDASTLDTLARVNAAWKQE